MKVISFSQQGPRAICILSANGVISSVTLRHPDSSGGTLTYEVLPQSSDPTCTIVFFPYYSFSMSAKALQIRTESVKWLKLLWMKAWQHVSCSTRWHHLVSVLQPTIRVYEWRLDFTRLVSISRILVTAAIFWTGPFRDTVPVRVIHAQWDRRDTGQIGRDERFSGKPRWTCCWWRSCRSTGSS